jgi:hypothetical protein
VNPSMGAWAAGGRPDFHASHSPDLCFLRTAANFATLNLNLGCWWPIFKIFLLFSPYDLELHERPAALYLLNPISGLCEAGRRAQAPMDGFTACPDIGFRGCRAHAMHLHLAPDRFCF